MASTIFLVALFVIAGWWIWRLNNAHDIRRADTGWLPTELKNAMLVYSEKQFRTNTPFPLVARIDRGYQAPNNTIVLVDFKRRKRQIAYLSDIVEISAQRVAMRGNGVSNVAMHAYVVVIDPDTNSKTPIRIDLEDEASVERRRNHRNALLNGSAIPSRTRHKGICDGCGHQGYCQGPQRR